MKYKKIDLWIVGDNSEINIFLERIWWQIEFTLIDKKEKINNVKKLLKNLWFIDDDILYFRENSEENEKLSNLLLLET